MKEVNIISNIVSREQSGKKLPGGSTIMTQGGSVDLSEIKKSILADVAKLYLSKTKDDKAAGVIDFAVGMKIASVLVDKILQTTSEDEALDTNVMTSARVVKEIEEAIERMKEIFLRKDTNDRTHFKINVGDRFTAEKGLQIGESFVPGILTGSGGFFDEFANGEVESLIIRRFLEVPELRFNRVEVKLGDKWNAPGAGIFERVEPDKDTEGNNLLTGTGWLKLEEGEAGAIAVGDICMGIFHSFNSAENATEDSDDSRGNFKFSGFYTCYFTITEITGKENKQFRYQMRPVSDRWKLTYHPSEAMTFVCYGSFNREDRQTSVYTTRTYTRLLKNQNTWEISAANIAMQYGNMENMSVHGIDMTGYSMYLNNIYMTGTLKQIKPDGTPVNVANDRGNYIFGDTYAYYDRVSHNGSLWLCINENGTDTEPTKGNSDWLLQVASGASLSAEGRFNSSNTPYQPNSVVEFTDRVWINTEVTSDAPFGCFTDNNGNRLLFNDGGFILCDDVQSQAWSILIDISNFTDGKDGEGLIVQYSADKVNWHDTFVQGSDIYMRQKVGKDGVWSEAMRIVGEDGQAKEGIYTDFQFAVNSSLTNAPSSGWQDAPPSVGIGQFLWMRVRVVDPTQGTATNWEVTRIGGEKGANGENGEDGQSISLVGDWKTGLYVPYLGIVRMGGASWSAKKETSNPPLWCWTDNNGNRLLFGDGGYIITGEKNDTEYQEVATDGATGKDGVNGKDGKDGLQGLQGCVIRSSEWAAGVEYRNDEGQANGYIDVALVRNDNSTTGWDAYKCKKTHVSTSSITPTNTTYWEEFGANVSAIFTSLIVAKNAKITFLQGNQLLVQKSNGTITAGISGSESGSKTRIWAGSQTPDSAPFRVNEDGEAWMDDAHIKGEIEATSGTIANFSIEGGTLVNNDSSADIILRNSKTNATREAMVGLQSIPSTTGGAAMGVFRNHEEYAANFGIIVSAKNGNINEAIGIEAGCISGVAYKTKVVYSGSATISRGVNVVVLVNYVSAITLPKLEACDNGYRMIVVNKRNVAVNIYGRDSNFFITTDNFISTSVPAGASAEFVFVNELSHTFPSTEVGTKTGAWVKL